MSYKIQLSFACTSICLLPLILSACSASSQPAPTTKATTNPTSETIISVSEQPTSTPLQPCEGDVAQTQPQYTIVDSETKAELIWQTQFVPWWVRPSSDGRVLAVTDGGDSIYELKPDGTLSVAFHCPGVMIETFATASDGALWFATRDGGRLYRVDPNGQVKILAQNGNRYLEAGLDGSVLALENGLVLITPDGTTRQITENVAGRKFAVGPNGEVVTLGNGNILRVLENGDVEALASGYGPEPWLTFGPDGYLYVTHWSGVDVIDIESGNVTPMPWLKGSNISEAGTFAPDGRLLLYHPNTDVYAIDLTSQTIETFYQVTSNSWAMAANPDDAIYVAFGNNLSNGETIIYRVVDRQSLEPVVSVPYGIERSMAFDSQGIGYLAVGDQAKGGAIYRFDPSSDIVELYHQPQCFPGALAIHPQTNQLWWNDCNRTFESLDENGKLFVINGVEGGENASLAITPEGEFYTITFLHRNNPNTPYKHSLYHWDMITSTWEIVADLTQIDTGITLSTLVACPDGHIYTVESLDARHVPTGHPSFNAVRRLEPDGKLTLLGFDFGFDGLAADCDNATGRIIFTSAVGIFAVTPP